MVSSWHNKHHSPERETKLSEDGVRLPTWRGNWKRLHTQSSQPMQCTCTCTLYTCGVHIPGDSQSIQLRNATPFVIYLSKASSPVNGTGSPQTTNRNNYIVMKITTWKGRHPHFYSHRGTGWVGRLGGTSAGNGRKWICKIKKKEWKKTKLTNKKSGDRDVRFAMSRFSFSYPSQFCRSISSHSPTTPPPLRPPPHPRGWREQVDPGYSMRSSSSASYNYIYYWYWIRTHSWGD